MDPRGAPERVLAAHTADEITGFERYGRASISPPSRFPSPIKAKAFAMPTDDSLWLHNDQHLTPVRQDPRKDHPQQPICQTQRRTWRGPLDRGELMAKRQELQLKNRAAAEAVAEQRKNGEKDDCIHARDAIQPRSRTPGFLPPIRFSGTTTAGYASRSLLRRQRPSPFSRWVGSHDDVSRPARRSLALRPVRFTALQKRTFPQMLQTIRHLLIRPRCFRSERE